MWKQRRADLSTASCRFRLTHEIKLYRLHLNLAENIKSIHTHERPPVATQIQYTAPEMHSVIFLLYANEVLELHVFFPCFPPNAPSDRFILWGCSQTCYFRKRCTPNKCRYVRYLIENCTYGDQQSGKMQALPFLPIKKRTCLPFSTATWHIWQDVGGWWNQNLQLSEQQLNR